MSPGRFLQRQGDVVYDVTCTEVRIPLREMEQCFREILVQHEDHRFTDPTTRVLVMTVSQSDIPKPHYTAPVVMDHDWGQDVGVFTATELEDWAHLASVGHLTQRSAEILATGFCQSEEDCPLAVLPGTIHLLPLRPRGEGVGRDLPRGLDHRDGDREVYVLGWGRALPPLLPAPPSELYQAVQEEEGRRQRGQTRPRRGDPTPVNSSSGTIPKGGCNGLMESAGDSNQRKGGQRNGWTDPGVKWSTGLDPGVKRSTELVLAQDKGPAEKRQ